MVESDSLVEISGPKLLQNCLDEIRLTNKVLIRPQFSIFLLVKRHMKTLVNFFCLYEPRLVFKPLIIPFLKYFVLFINIKKYIFLILANCSLIFLIKKDK